MPKIEIHSQPLRELSGWTWKNREELEFALMSLKGEVDEAGDDGVYKLEFNDTNRPDLWSTAGAARSLKVYREAKVPVYNFFSTPEKSLPSEKRKVVVDASLGKIRPYIAAFVISGKAINDQALRDLIQTQEKLCWNFGRKRKSIAMGVYRSHLIQWPVSYSAVNPDSTKFIPLGMDESLSLREIVRLHPKGKEYGHIVAGFSAFPFLTDAGGEILSFPPVINSSRLGAVVEGDGEIFVEMTGTDLVSLTLAASIVACDMADLGFTILPVMVSYPYDTLFGKEITFPYFFQKSISTTTKASEKLLGLNLSEAEIATSLTRMGMKPVITGETITILPPPYRNDFLHEVDIIEDIMMGHGIGNFKPLQPSDSTFGRITVLERLAREVRDLMIGLGFQEMIYNYLGSGKDFITRMNIPGENLVQIVNPMTENYEFVRNSIAPNLLESESVSANAVYPHKIFEVGKTAILDGSDPSGTQTLDCLGFLIADREADFNLINTVNSALAYYLGIPYQVEETHDPRFIPGRCGALKLKDKTLGVFGEVHPQVLENWNIGTPCVMGEWNLGVILNART